MTSFNCVLKLAQDTCGQYVNDVDSPHQDCDGCPSCVHRCKWEISKDPPSTPEARLMSFFRPTTLAAIVADLNSETTKSLDRRVLRFYNLAYLQGVACVGKENFKAMIQKAI